MITITWLRDFIFDYYINPIIHDTGYNPVNTLTWALILAPLCIILVLKLLRRFRVAIDEAFIAAVSPYILLGAVIHSRHRGCRVNITPNYSICQLKMHILM